MTFAQNLAITLISILLGGLIVNIIVEDYKNDNELKKSLLDDYFSPTIKNYSSCLDNQRLLPDIYLKDSSSHHLFLLQIKKVINNPELEKNYDFQLATEALLQTSEKAKDQKEKLERTVFECKKASGFDIENLAIATGTFDFYKEKSMEKNIKMQKIESNSISLDSNFIKKYQELSEDMFNGKFGEEFYIKNNINTYISMSEKMLNFSKSKSEQLKKIYSLDFKYFEEIRSNAASNINLRFSHRFLFL